MHLLLSLFPCDRPSTPAQVDSVIHAYWPDPQQEPILFNIVKHCMVHGPCGPAFPYAPCIKNGKCSKGFPKPYQQHTLMTTEGYPTYACPPDGQSYNVGKFAADNRWIVPYNPYFLLRYIVSVHNHLDLIFHMQVQCPHKCGMCHVFGSCEIHH